MVHFRISKVRHYFTNYAENSALKTVWKKSDKTMQKKEKRYVGRVNNYNTTPPHHNHPVARILQMLHAVSVPNLRTPSVQRIRQTIETNVTVNKCLCWCTP